MASRERRHGVHTSIAGGIHLALERARELGCTTVQIFSHNPRQWYASTLPKEAVRRFRELRETYDIHPVFIHTSYLINLAAVNSDILNKSIALLAQEMDLADALGADYVVLHTGSASQDDAPRARRRAVASLQEISKRGKWTSRLLLENTAGERGDISSRMEDLAEIMEGADTPLIGGVCIDTCHAFAAGYEISGEEGLSTLISEIDHLFGLDAVRLVHLNDSKKGCNAHVDRHEHIGEGAIGQEGLARFVNHPAFREVPLILETPKKSEEDDPRNLRVVRGLLLR